MFLHNRLLVNVVFASLLVLVSNGLAAADNYSQFLKRLSINDGLSQSSVTKITQDHAGYIWLGTEMGLNRYDGYQIIQVAGPSRAFTQQYINTIFVDGDGYVWVATATSGLWRVDPTSLAATLFIEPQQLNQTDAITEVYSIKQAKGNNLWLSLGSGTYLLDVATKKLTQYFSLNDSENYVRTMLVQDNEIYSATTKGLYKTNIDTKASIYVEHRPNEMGNVDTLNTKLLQHQDEFGLFVGTVDGLYLIDLKGQRKLVVPGLNIWDLSWHNDHYMIATDSGFYRYHPKTAQLALILRYSDSHYNTAENRIVDVLQDRVGNFWLATKSQGVMLWSPKTTRFSLGTGSNIDNENIWALHLDDKRDLWIGTDNGLFKVADGQNVAQPLLTARNLTSIDPLPVIDAISANKSDSNLLWLSKADALYSFNKTTHSLIRAPLEKSAAQQLGNKWFGGVTVIDESHIFFLSDDGYYQYNSNSGEITPLPEISEVTSPLNTIGFLGQLPNRPNTVLLTTNGRLFEYNYVSRTIQIIFQVDGRQSETSAYVNSWVVDRFGTLWLALSGKGVVGLNPKTLAEKYRFGVVDGLMSADVYQLELDELDQLWVSSQKGLHRIDLVTFMIEHFDSNDGLVNEEFNAGASAKHADGRLSFGTQSGVVSFDPENFTRDSKPLKVFPIGLSYVEVVSSGRKLSDAVNQDNHITLAHDEFGLRIQFSTLHYHKQLKTRYDVNISGPTAFNIPALQNNELFLPHLPPGSYKLTITAQANSIAHPSAPLELTISVRNPPWLTLPALILYFIIALIIGFTTRHFSTKRKNVLLAAHQKVKENKAQMELALKGSGSGVWDYKIPSDEFYQQRITGELGHPQGPEVNSSAFLSSLVAPHQYPAIKTQWLAFISGAMDNWSITYQLRHKDNSYVWYRDTGRVIERDDNGKPTRVSGTYTNINKTKVAQEQSMLLGKTFSKISDGVLVLDSAQIPVTANDAFFNTYSGKLGYVEKIWQDLLERLEHPTGINLSQHLTQMMVQDEWQGEATVEVKNHRIPVLLKITAVGDQSDMVSHFVVVVSNITAQKEAQNKLTRLAHYDSLTDLPKRKLVIDTIEKLIESEQHCALLFIDLDKFKQVNELYGHSVGDELLIKTSLLLQQSVDYYDMVARHNGDEFMVLITTNPTVEKLEYVASRIIEQISTPFIIEGHQLHISACVGIATYPDHSNSARSLIQKSDLAMIHAKHQGRGQVQFFTPKMAAKAQERLELEDQVRVAELNHQFTNHYQPIIDHKTGKAIGFELLLRWFSNDKFISPATFIPVAEEIGLIAKMTVDAIDRALADFVTINPYVQSPYISVNLSPIHIIGDGLVDSLKQLLKKHQLPASTLRLEITEGTLLADLDLALVRLRELRDCGFKLLLDDFGTGYSSLTYLSRFPVNVIKIDKSFVMNFEKSAQDAQIIKAIISLARDLNLSCIAEGVETKEQLDYIKTLGCQYIQGYYYAKPMPIDRLINYLGESEK